MQEPVKWGHAFPSLSPLLSHVWYTDEHKRVALAHAAAFFRAVLWLSWLLHVTGRLTAGSSKFWFCVCTPVHWTLKATMVIAASSY